jgi:hypothetical protein
MCAFPLHVWTLLLAFRDVSWVTQRTNAWDAVGVLSYGLVFAFIESVVVFLVTALLGLLISTRWDEPQRIALLSVLVLAASLWAMYAQAYFVWNFTPSGQFIQFVSRSRHPLRFLYTLASGAVLMTVLTPTVLVLRSAGFFRFVRAVIERLTLLTVFYLVFDALGLMVIIIRNF